jgi:superfamily II DNA or RNA helicase|tara:strand:+ start:2917 stop:4284 length:1368 start_codon:yes stop_codon:yes gene_type:complete
MNKVALGGGVFLAPGYENESVVLSRFEIANPEYQMAMGMRQQGKYVPIPDKHINACHRIPYDHPWGGGLAVPRKAATQMNLGQIVDVRTDPAASSLQLAKGFSLRDYQLKALDSWKSNGGEGVVIAPCGAGKTAIGVAAMAEYNTKALVLVHTNDLAVQWMNRIESMLNEKATQYGAGKKNDSGRVVVATFQTLERMSFTERYAFGRQFGLCIVDEAHHVPAHTFCSVMFCMPARYRLGLTATPERPDGLTSILWWHFGSPVYEITNEQLTVSGHVVPPSIEWLFTDYTGPRERVDWSKLITKMTTDPNRNQKILDRVLSACFKGRQILVLSDRVDHCIWIAEQLKAQSIVAEPLVGKMTKKQRADVLQRANDRMIQVVCATTVADEGLDLPSLDTVVLTTPSKAMGRIQQRIGRVMRPHPQKQEPIVIDCVDDSGPMHGLARKRQKLYTKLGCN